MKIKIGMLVGIVQSRTQRWRNIATSEIYTHPQQKVVLCPRRHSKPSKPTLSVPHPARRLKRDIEPLDHILDRFGDQQKKDVSTLSSGHLNPNHANQHLERYLELQKPPIKFGKTALGGVKDIPALSMSSNNPTADTTITPNGHNSEPLSTRGTEEIASSNGNSTTLGVGDMIDLLSKFDMVKLRDKGVESKKPPILDVSRVKEEKTRPVRQFIPSYQLNLTKKDQFKMLQLIDKTVVQRAEGLSTHASGGSKCDRLQKYQKFIQQELELNHCPSEGPDLKRLEIYSKCFDTLITEFRTYAPLLAEIKNEYDRTVLSFQGDQSEVNFLRTKVQKLLSQNENRLLLKFERKKARELETQVESLRAENEKLKFELRRKLALYASYLPASVLHEKKKTDSLLAEVEHQIQNFDVGEDPISVSECQIEILQETVKSKLAEMNEMKRLQDLEYIPRITKEKIEESLRDVEDKLKKYTEKNSSLESHLAEKQSHIRQLEIVLREKEKQYLFLITEYNELSEAMASSNIKGVSDTQDIQSKNPEAETLTESEDNKSIQISQNDVMLSEPGNNSGALSQSHRENSIQHDIHSSADPIEPLGDSFSHQKLVTVNNDNDPIVFDDKSASFIKYSHEDVCTPLLKMDSEDFSSQPQESDLH
ncbi:hypothetical protein BASA50_000825 [Batrachochytrium salamandrivorans]|uniref:Translin-associated factor X-interacting protein 1 N-terminal domain-containing protein n=1 Tax=Batrachochytrium salamandrivorans TaxID=1357716 RepID=A0ABQ8EVF2_9FUNG|nr:hypothetical protein BASA50_000825 [Batrachochytrium salamandrivorans]